jgi:hypothetical protein
MPLPTITLRVAPEHHRLFRDIGAAIRTRPELANVLQAQHDSGITDRDTNVLQPFVERLELTRDLSVRTMAFAESINERLIRFPPEHFIHSGSKPLIINGIF